MSTPRMLGVMLSYNDDDVVADAVRTMLDQGHDLIVWEHGSNAQTKAAWEPFRNDLMEFNEIPREFDFYQLYPTVSQHIIEHYASTYDWVSWPDFDEFLEGPDRTRPYRDWVAELIDSPYDWIEFRNMNFWWTTADDPSITSPVERVQHYSWFSGCAPRIRSWRASVTNVREFNHNPLPGERYPEMFNLRHYPMRTKEQMELRIARDRAGLRRGDANFHYDNMAQWRERLTIAPDALHVDDGGELNLEQVFDWRSIYGWGSSTPEPDANATTSRRSLFSRFGRGTRPAS